MYHMTHDIWRLLADAYLKKFLTAHWLYGTRVQFLRQVSILQGDTILKSLRSRISTHTVSTHGAWKSSHSWL